MRLHGVITLLVIGGSVLLAFIISNYLQRRITNPVLKLAESARAVSENIQLELLGKLTHLTGRKVKVGFVTDPDLLGGIVTRIGSTVYDGSGRNQLQMIKEKMAG